jgi:hypothetical protein
MPRKGWSVITVTDELKAKIAKIAVKEGRTVPKVIERMVDAELKSGV